MSKRLIIVDDHTMSVIGDEDAITTGLSITFQRGQESITAWDGLNLSDESFTQLVKLVSEFVDSEPVAQADTAEQVTHSRPAEFAKINALIAAENDGTVRKVPASTPVLNADGQPIAVKPVAASTATPAGKRDGKAVRAWWYALDAKVLSALSLPTPDRSRNIGKLPVAVYDAYDSAHA